MGYNCEIKLRIYPALGRICEKTIVIENELTKVYKYGLICLFGGKIWQKMAGNLGNVLIVA